MERHIGRSLQLFIFFFVGNGLRAVPVYAVLQSCSILSVIRRRGVVLRPKNLRAAKRRPTSLVSRMQGSVVFDSMKYSPQKTGLII